MGPPVLWQYSFSNYNEKVRWALDHKSVPHVRRSLMPGGPRAMVFSARGTLPVVDLDGERLVDSTRIIAALEKRYPDPPLYPADPDAARAGARHSRSSSTSTPGTRCDRVVVLRASRAS